MSYLDGGGGDDDEDDAVEASGSAFRRPSDMRFQRSMKQITMRRTAGTGPTKDGRAEYAVDIPKSLEAEGHLVKNAQMWTIRKKLCVGSRRSRTRATISCPASAASSCVAPRPFQRGPVARGTGCAARSEKSACGDPLPRLAPFVCAHPLVSRSVGHTSSRRR
jgi:hypothetical protein